MFYLDKDDALISDGRAFSFTLQHPERDYRLIL